MHAHLHVAMRWLRVTHTGVGGADDARRARAQRHEHSGGSRRPAHRLRSARATSAFPDPMCWQATSRPRRSGGGSGNEGRQRGSRSRRSAAAMAQKAQAGDPASRNPAAGRRKTKHEKALAELAFNNPGVKAAVAAVAQSPPSSSAGSASSWLTRARKASETESNTSHEDLPLPPPPTRKSLCGAVCQGRLDWQEERDLQRATEASRWDATSAAGSAAPRGGAGGASGGCSKRDISQGDVSPFCGLPNLGNTCFVSAVMQLLFPVYCPSAAAAEAVGSGGGSKVSETFSQLMAAMLPGNAAGKLSSMVEKFIDALFSDSEVGSWSKFGLQDGDGETRQRGQQQSADEFLQFMVEKIQWLHARFAYTEKGQAASILYVDLAPMADVELSALIHAQYAGGVLPLSGFQDHLAVVIKRWRKKGLQVVKDPQIISKWEILVIYNQNGNVHAQFELSGFIQHKGHAPDQGHYICCSKRTHANRTEWLTFDDKHISPREEAPRAREEVFPPLLHHVQVSCKTRMNQPSASCCGISCLVFATDSRSQRRGRHLVATGAYLSSFSSILLRRLVATASYFTMFARGTGAVPLRCRRSFKRRLRRSKLRPSSRPRETSGSKPPWISSLRHKKNGLLASNT
jgi:hypothetical protein